MKRAISLIYALSLCLSMTTAAAAQEEVATPTEPAPVDDGPSTHVIGGYATLGMATMIVENCSNCSIRFAGGGGAYYNLFPTRVFGIHAGVGLMGRGLKASGIANQTDQEEQKIKVLYLDVPLGIKLRFGSFRLGLGVSLDFALSGKSENPDMDFNDEMWEFWARRFNLGAWMNFAWAIPVGPIAIVLGFGFNMHILDEVTMENANNSVRPLNIMGNLGVEFGL
jgi:hypothetical protein